MDAKVTPWEVKGSIDYKKLIKEFGLQELPELPKKFLGQTLFRRGIIFAHRDIERILGCVQQKKPFAMMTGLMPSGKFHFGHKMVADQCIFYQELGANVYITVADVEGYNSRIPNMEELRKIAIEEYLMNYVALGLDLKKCDFYFQSKRSLDGKKASAYYSLASTLARHATFNEFKAVYGEIDPGKMASSLLQAADMFHPQLPEFEGRMPVIVPVGSDQDPHIRLARDICGRYKVHDFCQLSSTYHLFMPGLKGGKMSSSDPMSYIALTDSPDEASKKIMKYAFSGGQATLEEHRKKGGNPEIDVSFQMLRYGLEEDDEALKEIYLSYKAGKLLSGELKKIAAEKVSEFLEKHHKARKKAEKTVASYVEKQGF